MAATQQVAIFGKRFSETADLELEKTSAFLMFLNLLDGLFTLSFLQMNVAEEVNPIMRLAYGFSPLWFMISKLGLVSLGILILYSNRRAMAARLAIHSGAVLYCAIVTYHLTFLYKLLRVG